MAHWTDVKARKRELDRAAGRDTHAAKLAAQSRTHAYVLGYRLSELRERAGLSQTEVARRMGVTQPRVSALEKGDPAQMEVETLDRYIAALGGRMRVVAGFGDHEEIVSVTEIDREQPISS
jgi:predicted XRE-type DNA-binding protein